MEPKKTELNIFKKRSKKIKIFERAGLFLRIYRSGKIPKIIKFIPILKNFEEILWLTRPDRWSFQALFTITRMFFSKLNQDQLKRFFCLVLVPRFQEEIFKKKKINPHLFLTIKLSAKKEKFFFSNLIIPICSSKNCTTREAIFLASIISNCKFSINHILCLVLILIKDKLFSNSRCLILRGILSKKYNLPNRILEYLMDFFLFNKNKIKLEKFRNCFLIFIKNYSAFFSIEEKSCLLKILP
ncbi:bystin-like protein (nucleomorph) [Hemiselmis andersenii]|uniref:Bystin-like protein n=1 Tax=Hemiselmis andersenii TaxID=464988 RepID=A9BKR7_HEMAN|nr:bystin-like protein [Hemiselmis andersenii]ABW98072.1 bystin-like protein [Hemiselmis andersenii]